MEPDVQNIIRKNGIEITPSQFGQLEAYVELLLDWNKKINLISRQDVDRIWTNHILLSLSFCFQFDFPDGSRILDLGTGGGLPGVPLSILHPAVEFLLVDSIRKKTQAVESMINALGLRNATVVWTRAEDLRSSFAFKPYDSVIARSVSAISNLTSVSLPLLRTSDTQRPALMSRSGKTSLPSPALIAMKGGDIAIEVGEAQQDHPKASFEMIDLSFPGKEFLINRDKKLVIVRKKVTPK